MLMPRTACGEDVRFEKRRDLPDGRHLWEARTPYGAISMATPTGHTGSEYATKYTFPCMRVDSRPRSTVSCTQCDGKADRYRVAPQFDSSTGRCWWTALLAAVTYPKAMADIFVPAICETGTRDVVDAIQSLIQGRSEPLEHSERIRTYVHDRFGVGFGPETAPKDEGCNARVELMKLCEQLRIPFCVTYVTGQHRLAMVPADYPRTLSGPPRVLIVSSARSEEDPWVPSANITMTSDTGEPNDPHGAWCLQAMLVGNEDAGHQVSISTCDGSVREWMLADSDAAMIGVQNTWFSCDRDEDWVRMLAAQIPLLSTSSASGGTSFAPVNTSARCTARPGSCSDPGMTNVDFIYTRETQ